MLQVTYFIHYVLFCYDTYTFQLSRCGYMYIIHRLLLHTCFVGIIQCDILRVFSRYLHKACKWVFVTEACMLLAPRGTSMCVNLFGLVLSRDNINR